MDWIKIVGPPDRSKAPWDGREFLLWYPFQKKPNGCGILAAWGFPDSGGSHWVDTEDGEKVGEENDFSHYAIIVPPEPDQ